MPEDMQRVRRRGARNALLAMLIAGLSAWTYFYSVQIILCLVAVSLSCWAARDINRCHRAGIATSFKFGGGVSIVFTVVIMSLLLLAHGPFMPQFHMASVRTKVARTKADLRLVDDAMAAYREDHDRYPMSLAPALTSPVGYLKTWPTDLFAKPKGRSYSLYRWNDIFCLGGVGPDGDCDLDWIPTNSHESDEPFNGRLLASTYDPTNGISSNGDVVRKVERDSNK